MGRHAIHCQLLLDDRVDWGTRLRVFNTVRGTLRAEPIVVIIFIFLVIVVAKGTSIIDRE